ncbi:OadG family protein [Tissierella praeacuta]|uniref:OadG family protein n=1 Tax=Tissierella praeacuta TaxID=43131 RepID=UPI003341AAED
MGDIISLGDSLVITVFSMVVVFAGLIVLAMLISVLKKIGGEKKSEVVKKSPSPIESKETIVENVEESLTNDEELVAVIAAAVAASLGISIPEVNIKSIRRIPQNSPAWATASRQEQIYGKL